MFRENHGSMGLKYDRIRPVHENKIAINEYRLKVDETGFVESRGLDICEYAKKKMTVCLATFRSWSRGTFDPETLLSFVGSETVLKQKSLKVIVKIDMFFFLFFNFNSFVKLKKKIRT